MSKRGQLSKAEKFYIENNISSELEGLAKDLDRAVSSIEKYASKVRKSNKITVGDQFANNGKGSIVMTENASSMADETRKKRTIKFDRDCVAKIKNEE